MPLRPKASDIPAIRGAVKFYRLSAYVTGTMLLLLVLEMIFKYTPMHRELDLGGANGFVALVPWDQTGAHSQITGLNLSTGILIAHGWLYVVYLFLDFRLWSLMRWPFSRFIQIALGGVVPFLSFIVEHFITRRVHRELAELEQSAQATVTTAEATNH
jgi:integral membrane protein